MTTYTLPYRDDRGFTNVLISAIGGDGANMATKLLFKIAVESLNLDGAYDARYGSEKKGTPTDVSLRLCNLGNPVYESGPTNRPHILSIFHYGLIKPLGLVRGLQPNATVVVNTSHTPEVVRNELNLSSGKIICLDATKIAKETKSRLNMPMTAILSKVLGFPEDLITESVTKQWPKKSKENGDAFQASFNTTRETLFKEDGTFDYVPHKEIRGSIGYLNMLNGGAVDALTHSTVDRVNMIAGYGKVPHFDKEACIGCAICMTVCSDPGGLKWEDRYVVGIDTMFCKGCMRCVAVCPPTKKGIALKIPEDGSN